MVQMVASWDRPLMLLMLRAHIDMRGNTAADKLASKARTGAAHVFTAAGKPGRGQHWIAYEPGPRPNGLQGDASEKWAVNDLKDHVRDLGTAAYAQQVLNSPKQSILKLIKRLTEEDGGD